MFGLDDSVECLGWLFYLEFELEFELNVELG